MKRAVLCTFLVAAALGCSRKEPREDAASTTTVTGAELEQPRQGSVATFLDDDRALTRRVEAAIALDPSLVEAARDVNISVDRGIVTLSGSVPDDPTREALRAAVASVPGVRTYDDDLQVSSGATSPDR